jgi:uncharacterized protein
VQKREDGKVLYSASDVVNFLECEHLTTLDLIDLEAPLPKSQDDDHAKLIQSKGFAHESRFLETLKARHARVADISACADDSASRAQATLEAMRRGDDVIFQATLAGGAFIGHADFLRRVERRSTLGPYSYEVLDTKLSRTAPREVPNPVVVLFVPAARLSGDAASVHARRSRER